MGDRTSETDEILPFQAEPVAGDVADNQRDAGSQLPGLQKQASPGEAMSPDQQDDQRPFLC